MGMTWAEVKEKYTREAYQVLGQDSANDIVEMYVYHRILERSCATNVVLDEIAHKGMDCNDVTKFIQSFGKTVEKITIMEVVKNLKPLIVWTSFFVAPLYGIGCVN